MSNGLNVEKMPLRSLLDLQERLDGAIHKAKDRERHEVRQEMIRLASKRGFTVKEVLGPQMAKSKRRMPPYAKYMNPENPTQTWAGWGRKPNWMVSAISKGATLEQFRR